VYAEAARTGYAPILVVERHFRVSRSTAGRWVAKARQADLLGQVRQGHRPSPNWKVIAVAEAVSVDPVVLHDAVLQHARGDLRVQDRRRSRTSISAAQSGVTGPPGIRPGTCIGDEAGRCLGLPSCLLGHDLLAAFSRQMEIAELIVFGGGAMRARKPGRPASSAA
jgi:hypothetical protein